MSLGNLDSLSTKSSTTFAALSYIPGLDTVPNTSASSTKNRPIQENHCKILSSSLTRMCL